MKQQHELEMMEYNEKKGKDASAEKPNKPPEKMLFIPANNSTTGVFQLLFDNEGRGLMFETEGDTLAQAFKTDYGNYSDGFRKAFHHEQYPTTAEQTGSMLILKVHVFQVCSPEHQSRFLHLSQMLKTAYSAVSFSISWTFSLYGKMYSPIRLIMA